jgi:two-component sensor histidine kinase
MSLDGPRVLYIDDDAALRRLAQRVLVRRGYRVELAAGGSEGLAKVAEGEYDLVAVDHYMPDLDGLATLERLLEQPDAPPVVYVTGSEESRVAVAALKAGAADYVVKTIGDDFFDLLDSSFRQSLAAVTLRREKAEAEAKLRASNEQLEAMLAEVNHRVANSLQLISSFVHMQAAAVTDEAAKQALADTQQRIAAIAQVHRRLYNSRHFEAVDMKDYLTALASELEHTWSTPASPRAIRLDADPLLLKTDKAVSLGIIVTELVSNACKYAYPSGASGEVRICFTRDGDRRFSLTVEDDGVGFQKGAAPKGTGVGSKLISAMARTLRSEISIESGAGGVQASLTGVV